MGSCVIQRIVLGGGWFGKCSFKHAGGVCVCLVSGRGGRHRKRP